MRLLLLAASARQDSVNKKLISQVAFLLKNIHQLDIADFNEFDVPLYHGDLETTQGLPSNAKKFIERINQANGIILSTPEYNFSIPGTLKNLIDWVSRDKSMPWKNKKILLMSASPSQVGGNRGLWHTRVPLEACGAIIYPDMFSLANAYQAFNENLQLIDTNLQQRLQENLNNFISFLTKLA